MIKIFIECSTTINSPYLTGIQRVVKSIIEKSALAGEALGVECIPVVYVNGGLFVLNLQEKVDKRTQLLNSLLTLSKKLNRVIPRLNTVIKHLFTLMLLPLIHSFFNRINTKEIFVGVDITKKNLATTTPSNKNILLLLDSTWDLNMFTAIDRFRLNGGHVCAVLYDIIPFTHPETVEKHTGNIYRSWWRKAPRHLDSIMCISNSVKQEYLTWQKSRKLKRSIHPDMVGYFYLGADLGGSDNVIRILSTTDPFFMVLGSLEPRKNHSTVIDAFEILWKKNSNVNLVIVGRHGWKSDNLIKRIKLHKEYGSRLFLIRDATDRDLFALYQKCNAVIMASFSEGFGLPIVEAMQAGVNVICSDIPVFREIAGESAVYFDPLSTESLEFNVMNSLNNIVFDQNANNQPKKSWISWEQSTHQLLTKVIGLSKI